MVAAQEARNQRRPRLVVKKFNGNILGFVHCCPGRSLKKIVNSCCDDDDANDVAAATAARLEHIKCIFFRCAKMQEKNYTLKLSALGALTKIEAFLPKSNSDHQTGGRQGLNRRALCAATPIYRLPLRMTGRTSDLHFFLSSEELTNIFPDVTHCTIMSFCAPCGDLLLFLRKEEGKNSTKFMI